ncbi:MAG TPA: RhuM family protein [Rhabdochlamydiaceae bacterium]|nr:RhuM family protein [Rhabdochlamydiaceae bacterium]
MSKEKKANIRNSTAEFLIFTGQSGENSIEVRIAEESVWLTQKLMGVLFEVSFKTINEHLINLFDQKEISREATIRNFRIVQKEGSREVARNIEFYNLEAIIAVGFRVNSQRAIQFRQWAVGILKDFAIRGCVLDKERLKNGSFFNKAYFDNLLEECSLRKNSQTRCHRCKELSDRSGVEITRPIHHHVSRLCRR